MTLREQLIEAASKARWQEGTIRGVVGYIAGTAAVDAVISVLREQGPQIVADALTPRAVLPGDRRLELDRRNAPYRAKVAIDALFPPSDKAE